MHRMKKYESERLERFIATLIYENSRVVTINWVATRVNNHYALSGGQFGNSQIAYRLNKLAKKKVIGKLGNFGHPSIALYFPIGKTLTIEDSVL